LDSVSNPLERWLNSAPEFDHTYANDVLRGGLAEDPLVGFDELA